MSKLHSIYKKRLNYYRPKSFFIRSMKKLFLRLKKRLIALNLVSLHRDGCLIPWPQARLSLGRKKHMAKRFQIIFYNFPLTLLDLEFGLTHFQKPARPCKIKAIKYSLILRVLSRGARRRICNFFATRLTTLNIKLAFKFNASL